ncbi:MAG: hypothetical protein HY706_04330 [Candidatus Hydrogenedentes bacterium]|nr:hypothetical protein [Candidatus Hydrogenedentota bacterium]
MNFEADSFDVRRTLTAMREVVFRRKWVVFATCAITVALMQAYIHYFPWVYKASVKVLVEPEKDVTREMFYDRWNVFRKAEQAQTEAELVKMAPVVKEVVQRLDLKYEDVYHPILRVITDLWARSFVGRNYQRMKRYLFPPKKTPYDVSDEEKEFAKTVVDFQKGIRVESVGSSNVAAVTVLGPSPGVAAMANTLYEVYLRHRNERHREEAMSAYNVLKEQTQRAYQAVQKVEQDLKDFGEKHEVRFEFDKERNDVLEWSKQEAILFNARSSRRQMEERLAEIDRQLKSQAQSESVSQSLSTNEMKNRIKATLLDSEMKLVDMRNRYQPDSPEIQDAERTIQELKGLLGGESDLIVSMKNETPNPIWNNLRTERSAALTKLAELKSAEAEQEAVVKDYAGRLHDLPIKQWQLVNLTRELQVKDEEYRVLLDKERQAFISGVSEGINTASLKKVEDAAVPEKPSRPNVKLYLLCAALVGLLLGIGAAFIVDYFDDTLRAEDNIEHLMQAPVYAEIPIGENGNGRALLARSDAETSASSRN